MGVEWRHAGYTLVEVLVALLALALMSGLAWRGLDLMHRVNSQAQESLDKTHALNTALLQWEIDLTSWCEGGLMSPIDLDEGILKINRCDETGMFWVHWKLSEGRLTRWASPIAKNIVQHQDQRAMRRQAELAGQELTVLHGVASWRISFFRGNAWTHPMSSAEVLQPGESRAVLPAPAGVRLELEFQKGSGWQGPLRRQIEIPGGH